MTERDWIARYIRPLVTAPGAADLRDDAALLSASARPTIATMDTLVEARHFLSSDPISTVGQKLIRVNVSDCLAKGAVPHEALLSVSWPLGRRERDFAELMQGIGEDLKTFGVSLLGGDFVSVDGPLSLTLTLTGTCLRDAPVRRSGGQMGDRIWLSGEIGWGHVGLQAAQAGGDEQVANRYRVPKLPDFSAATLVAERATASLDVSDGLLIDAGRLANESGCGALIDLSRVPLARSDADLEAILAQCTAGDDYQILLSAPASVDLEGFSCIGNLIEKPGLALTYQGQDVNVPAILGFEH
ncbi:MAG: thiamine-phosphate kinase [Pseudomonadota bacterium]